MAKALSKDPDMVKLKEHVVSLLGATARTWMSHAEIDRLLPASGPGTSADLLLALGELAVESRIEHLRRPSDGEDVYRAKQPSPDGDMPWRVRVLEAELQQAMKRVAALERLVEDRTGPRSDR